MRLKHEEGSVGVGGLTFDSTLDNRKDLALEVERCARWKGWLPQKTGAF